MGNFENFKHTELTSKIINAAYYVYNYFGYGHLESVYEKSLAIKLRKEGWAPKIETAQFGIYDDVTAVGS